MTDPDPTKPQKSRCGYCIRRHHMRCRWLTHGVDCGCACSWLVADMREHFPSLREIALEETP